MKLASLVAPAATSSRAPIALGAAVALLTASACATHAPTPEENAPLTVLHVNATMPFANLHRQIDDWVLRSDGSLLIKSASGKFYHATFMGPCPWLTNEIRIGFKTDATGDLDKFSSILVDRQSCPFQTFDEVANPRPPAPPKT